MADGWKSRAYNTLKDRLGPPKRLEDWLLWGTVVGILSAAVAALFFVSLEWVGHAMGSLTGFHPPSPAGEGLFAEGSAAAPQPVRLWLLALLPAIGGLISGILVYTLAP